ncbi:hypothetical protein PHLGIDRAFT_127745, partial [Phlebiopsis gigantea 11061_1 CR5-6]
MVPPIPHELSDHVIDFLHDDHRALSACGLTCRAWLAAARYHRFADTSVCGKLGRFIDLLDASPGFAPFVKTLRWSGLAYQWFNSIDPTTLLSVLDRLPSLRELKLTNFVLDSTLISQLCSNESFIDLNGLALNYCSTGTPGEFVQLIRSPKFLKCLGVEGLRCASQDEKFDDSTPPPPVYSLAISGLQIPFMIDTADWLLSGSNRTAVRELRVHITSRVEARQTANLLGKQGEALQRLEIVIDPESNLEVELYESGLSLACLPNLRRCHLTFKLREMFVEGT